MNCFGMCFNRTKKLNLNEIKSKKSSVSATRFFEKDEGADLDNQSSTKNRFRKTAYGNVITKKQVDSVNKLKTIKRWKEKDKLRCFFCGGANCKRENYLNHKGKPAIIGLHSDYISDSIIASQRPSTTLINQFKLVNEFKREGEHPYCGPNTLEISSGFSYDPYVFIKADIAIKLAGWKDMSIPESPLFVLEIVKEMSIVIKEKKKKVLVHCHAGYGRTGVVIACYLIFDQNISAKEAVQILRRKRQGCIEKKEQFSFCERFKEFLDKYRIIFPINPQPIEIYVKHQKEIIFGEKAVKCGNKPLLIYHCFTYILEALNKNALTKFEILEAFYATPDWTEIDEDQLIHYKNFINKNDWSIFSKNLPLKYVTHLLYDWLEDCVTNLINCDNFKQSIDSTNLINIITNDYEKLKQLTKEERLNLLSVLKSKLRLVEFETLFFIAEIFNKLEPENEKELILYNQTMTKLIFYMIGPNKEFDENRNTGIMTENVNYIKSFIEFAQQNIRLNLLSSSFIALQSLKKGMRSTVLSNHGWNNNNNRRNEDFIKEKQNNEEDDNENDDDVAFDMKESSRMLISLKKCSFDEENSERLNDGKVEFYYNLFKFLQSMFEGRKSNINDSTKMLLNNNNEESNNVTINKKEFRRMFSDFGSLEILDQIYDYIKSKNSSDLFGSFEVFEKKQKNLKHQNDTNSFIQEFNKGKLNNENDKSLKNKLVLLDNPEDNVNDNVNNEENLPEIEFIEVNGNLNKKQSSHKNKNHLTLSPMLGNQNLFYGFTLSHENSSKSKKGKKLRTSKGIFVNNIVDKIVTNTKIIKQ